MRGRARDATARSLTIIADQTGSARMIAAQHRLDPPLVPRSTGLSGLVSRQLLSHGWNRITVCDQLRGEKGGRLDDSLIFLPAMLIETSGDLPHAAPPPLARDPGQRSPRFPHVNPTRPSARGPPRDRNQSPSSAPAAGVLSDLGNVHRDPLLTPPPLQPSSCHRSRIAIPARGPTRQYSYVRPGRLLVVMCCGMYYEYADGQGKPNIRGHTLIRCGQKGRRPSSREPNEDYERSMRGCMPPSTFRSFSPSLHRNYVISCTLILPPPPAILQDAGRKGHEEMARGSCLICYLWLKYLLQTATEQTILATVVREEFSPTTRRPHRWISCLLPGGSRPLSLSHFSPVVPRILVAMDISETIPTSLSPFSSTSNYLLWESRNRSGQGNARQ